MLVSQSAASLSVRARLLILLTAMLASAATAGDARAVTKTWTGGTNNDWSLVGNWSPAGAPASGDSVQFPSAGGNRSINLSGNRTVADVTFNSNGAYRLMNDQLTIASGDLANSLGNHRIDSNVVLGGEGAWSIPSGKLSVYGSVNSTTGNTFGIDKRGAGSLDFLNQGTTNVIKNYLHQAGAAEFFEGTYTLTSTSFDAFAAMYMAEGTVTVSHRAKLKGTNGGNLVLQSAGAGSSNMIIRDEQTEVATFGQLFMGASGTSGNSLTVTKDAKVRDIGLFVAGFNGSATVTVSEAAAVNSIAMAVGMLPGVTGTLTVEDVSSALTTNSLALGGYNSAQKGGTGTATISDRASLTVSGELRFFSSTSSLTVDSATASIGALTNEAGVVGSIKLDNDGDTPALTITSPVSVSAPGPFTFDGVISNASGAGGLVKQGPGEQIFTKQQTYTGGTRIEAGTLSLATANALASTAPVTLAGGTLNLAGSVQQTGTMTLQSGTVGGSAGSILLPTTLALQSGTIDVPVIAASAVNKTTAGIAVLNQGITATALNVAAGTLQIKGAINANLQSNPTSSVALSGPAIVSGTTAISGQLTVGAHAFTATQAVAIGSATLAGGSIVADAGVTLTGQASGYGAIYSRITGAPTTSITASGGPLTLGDAELAAGFDAFQGTINANAQQVNLLSAGVAKLGASTTLAGGSLSSLHGIQLDSGKTASGNGTINGAFKNEGTVNGAAGAGIRFTGSVSGAGSYAGSVQFDGAFSPGNSPAAVSFAGDATLANTSLLLMEIGGEDQATEYDHLDVAGKLTLGGVMAVQFINGFTPTSPLSFDLFNWGTVTGNFNALSLPNVDGFAWNTSQLLTTGTISLAPSFAADFDSNGRVDAADLAIWKTGYGAAGGRAAGDANGDNLIDGADFLQWQRQFGSGVAVIPASVSIPEPATLGLASVCGSALTLFADKRRRRNR